MTPRRRARLVGWFASAARRFGWRPVVGMAVCGVLFPLVGPNGGAYLFPGRRASDPVHDFLTGRWVLDYGFLFFATLAADAAVDDDVRPLPAYGAALVVGAFVGVLAESLVAPFAGWRSLSAAGGLPFNGFRFVATLLQGGLCLAVHAYERNARAATAQRHAAEAAVLRDRRHLAASRLRALQARVEPGLLFETLQRVGRLHADDPAGSDALLADLIALLRALLPDGAAAISTVERELALAAAWLRVQRYSDGEIDVALVATPEAARCGVAPMLVLPLVRAVLANRDAPAGPWRLTAMVGAAGDADTVRGSDAADRPPDARDGRLRIELCRVGPPTAGNAVRAASDDVADLHERLRALHGDDARLTVGPDAARLDLPMRRGEPER